MNVQHTHFSRIVVHHSIQMLRAPEDVTTGHVCTSISFKIASFINFAFFIKTAKMGMTYFGKELFNYATDCEEARIQ
jgi:hypothetical protein